MISGHIIYATGYVKPEVLRADEVVLSLDTNLANSLKSFIDNLKAEGKCAIVIADVIFVTENEIVVEFANYIDLLP